MGKKAERLSAGRDPNKERSEAMKKKTTTKTTKMAGLERDTVKTVLERLYDGAAYDAKELGSSELPSARAASVAAALRELEASLKKPLLFARPR